MACEVFKILNNIALTFIQNLIKPNVASIPCERITLLSSLRQTRPNMDLNHSCMMGPGPGTACQTNCEKTVVSQTDPELGWSLMQLLYM